MPKILLCDVGLRAIRPPEKGSADYWDANLPSFGVRVSQGGTKTFVINIGKTRRALGRFGVLSLSEARTEAKRVLAERTLGRTLPRSISFQSVVDEFLAEKEKSRRQGTVDNHRDRITRHFSFNCKLSEITHGEIVRRLSKIPTNAEHDHALSVAKTFFTWAMDRRYIDDNPTRGISPRGMQSRARVLSDEELKDIWAACSDDANDLPEPYRAIVKLLLLCGQRRGEIAALRTSFFDGTLVTLPGALTKNGHEHVFPLPNLAAEILRSVEVEAKQNDAFFFPARGKEDKCFNGWSKAMKALRTALGEHFQHFTLHDLRRTFRTNLGKLGVAPHIAERLVNHISSRSDVEIIYDRWTYMPEMRAAIERFDEWFSTLIAERSSSVLTHDAP